MMLLGAVVQRRLCWLLCCAMWLLLGCSTPQPVGNLDAMRWQGRLAIKVFASPVQAWSAGFVLTGNPVQGELHLTSPLGNVLAHLQWSHDAASLTTAEGEERFDSLDALMLRATGTPLPVAALFAWLQGLPATAPGWEVELPQLGKNRLLARQVAQEPQAELRIVLE